MIQFMYWPNWYFQFITFFLDLVTCVFVSYKFLKLWRIQYTAKKNLKTKCGKLSLKKENLYPIIFQPKKDFPNKKKSEENIFQQFHGIISVEKYRVRANRHTQSRFYYNKEGIYCAEREI